MNQIITNPVLYGSIAAESLVLYIQNIVSHLSSESIFPDIFANLEIGLVHSLYSIREINSSKVAKEADNMTNKITSQKYEELYLYDHNVQKLFNNYIDKQSVSWVAVYEKEKIRINTFNLSKNKENNI